MSFNINFNNNQPMIREAQKSQDGGAGNTGYFQVGEETEEKKRQQAGSIFADSNDEKDTFRHENESADDGFSFSKLIADIVFRLKCFLKKLFNLK